MNNYSVEQNDKQGRLKVVPIVNQAALEIIYARSRAEHRSRSNAASTFVLESSWPNDNRVKAGKQQETSGKIEGS